MPTVSVIIPCYDQGEYLEEAVRSVLRQTYQDFEIVVVDDGSTDEETIQILEKYNQPKTSVIRTSNQGLANARNTGIRASRGKYILPLDADDKIGSTYLEKAVHALDANESVGIVYCKAEFFGEAYGAWKLPAYRFPDILLSNQIFSSAFFRRADWTKVNGYSPSMIYGWEDYDLWLSLIELGRKVFCIPETLFFYRKRSNSMIAKMRREHYIYSYTQLYRNHPKLYADNIAVLFETIWTQENELQIFRTSKLQRLRSTILSDKLSVRKVLKIIYLVAALVTPKRMRLRLGPFIDRLKRIE